MTDKQFAAQKEPTRAEADRVVTLKTAAEITEHLKNIAAVMAHAMLSHWGWYGCRLIHADGTEEKVFFEVAA